MWERFIDLLFPPREGEQIVRATTYDELAALVAPVTLPTGAVALLPYRDMRVRSLIKEAKFHGNTQAHKLLGGVLAEYLQEYLADTAVLGSSRYALQAVPLSKERRRERGYNQAHEIALFAGEMLGLPVVEHVARVRNTAPQTSLERSARLTNLEGAFKASQLEEATYILIDDVSTTGATLEAARAALPADTVLIALAH